MLFSSNYKAELVDITEITSYSHPCEGLSLIPLLFAMPNSLSKFGVFLHHPTHTVLLPSH